MTHVRYFSEFSNVGAPSNSQQFRFANVNQVGKIHSVRVRGSLLTLPETLTETSTIDSPYMYGVQWGPAGYTPLVLPAQADAEDFLAVQHHAGQSVAYTWAPNTSTAGAVGAGALTLDWAGQLNMSEETIDFYVTITSAYSTSLTWESVGSIEILYTQ